MVDLACFHWAAQAINVEPHQLAEAGQVYQVISSHHRSTIADVQVLKVVPQSSKQRGQAT